MKILTVSYKQKFPTGSYLNCDIGFEASIGENENPEVAMKSLQDLAESFHKSSFSHLYTENGKPITIVQIDDDSPIIPRTNENSKQSTVERTIDQINQCSSEAVLLSFKLLAKANPEIQTAYDNKLKSFQ